MTFDYAISTLPITGQDVSVIESLPYQFADRRFGPTAIAGPRQEVGEEKSSFITSTDECDYSYSFPNKQEQTAGWSTSHDNDLLRLQRASDQIGHNLASNAEFAEVVATLDWCNKPAWFFKQAIGLALQLELPAIAHRLARMGCEQYPGDADLKRAERVLAPSKIVETARPPKRGLSASMAWLRQHAGEYRGVWVALRAGTLLGTAPSRDSLVRQLGGLGEKPDILIARIP